MKVVAVAGAKGGVGKTATAVNLAYLAAESGVSTLLWDLDVQGAATHCFRAEHAIAPVVTRRSRPDLATQIRRIGPNLDVMPAEPAIRVVESLLASRRGAHTAIKKLLAPFAGRYELVMLDCAPGLGLYMEAVLAASDLVVSPVIPAPLSLRSLEQLDRFIEDKQPGLALMAFLSMHDDRKVLHRQMVETVRTDSRFAKVAVPVSSSVERMGMEQRPAVEASPRNLAAKAYRSLWNETATRLGLTL